jgi:hypothetical protein
LKEGLGSKKPTRRRLLVRRRSKPSKTFERL